MDFDRFLPLIIVFIIWRLTERMRQKKKRPTPMQVDPAAQEFDIKNMSELKLDGSPLPAESLIADPLHVVAEKNMSQIITRKKTRRHKLSRKKIFLRQAVVWSEILSPPVSLRD